jgi:hydroxypyruvate reductase
MGAIEAGLVATKHGFTASQPETELHQSFTILEAGHPIPDESSVQAALRTLAMIQHLAEDDLVINLVSGGGSSVWTLPAEGLSLPELQRVTDLLLASGATIHEINCLRKHLTQLHGGRLAQCTNATILSLILSDVVGDDMSVIASAPTVQDSSTFQDALDVLERRQILTSAPSSIIQHLQRGVRGEIPETPKAPPANALNVLVGSNLVALRCIQERAQVLGYAATITTATLQGEARDVAQTLVCGTLSDTSSVAKTCIIAGGETTVTLRGNGKGGRNQEMAMAAALALQGRTDVVFLSAGTDGNDGPTDAAGGIVDGQTIVRGAAVGKNIDEALANNDSYHFLQASHDLLFTGATQTNVMDVQIILRHRQFSDAANADL